MLDHYQKGDNRSCSDSVDSPKKIKTWQWHRLETDENPGGQMPKEGVAVDKECGKMKGKQVSGGEHGEYPKIEWKPKKWGVAEVRRGKDRSGWFTFDQWERLILLLVRASLEVADGTERGPGSSLTLVIRGKDLVDGGILEMVLIHRSWARRSGLPGKRLEAEWEGRRHYKKKLERIPEEGQLIRPVETLPVHLSAKWRERGMGTWACKQRKVFELDGYEQEK
ncbi:hypothetical protein B0H16DRAFT_1474461 [Mycena metata]|uniref:Uncharacterized protein n=1 Tax=Mycena metata TaxID=1033252 RepID=A0AAD7HH04_9AGAR|nr:hypothetical protein B0H16DRAFT_1474461 [Mycena metata]